MVTSMRAIGEMIKDTGREDIHGKMEITNKVNILRIESRESMKLLL
jgi:hypothetical protein